MAQSLSWFGAAPETYRNTPNAFKEKTHHSTNHNPHNLHLIVYF